MSFYNTTHESKETNQHLTANTVNQDEAIRVAYRDSSYILTASEVHRKLNANWPLTSTRRSINTLFKNGILYKTTHKRKGMYGRPEYAWGFRRIALPWEQL